ncbi:DNA cytosine methyltransferase [uncultured Lactobacillus sp.]|uniref:DNA cytosine methyltransferase n=1 Tax=uncultured Lactobacillus sp. TaxID=153152 RepID=UPI0025D22155|nr:DNA cytosine methyltransferase [uncultured Lactobacillus sp.]
MNINAVDLFCGIGGLTYGVQRSGINVVAGIDIEEACRYPYTKNNNADFYNKDIKTISSTFVNSLYPNDTDIKVLMGCAPCQPFSSYSYRYKGSDTNKNKMDLLDYFGKIVADIKPDIVSMENVPQLRKEPIFKKFINLLKNNNYKVNWQIVYAPEYGVPQKRKRLVLLASKTFNLKLIPPVCSKDNYPTVRDAIGSLPPIKSGETSKLDSMHRAVQLSNLNLMRIKQSKPGGTWDDWDKKLLPKAYKKKSGQSYKSVYGRMKWDEPAPTITTQFYGFGNGRFGHPNQDRALSYREGAILQTFPKNYKFIDNEHQISSRKLGIMIGNAVPVKLGEAIGKSIMKGIEEDKNENNFSRN